MTTEDWGTIRLDIETMTLGEMTEAERFTGQGIDSLLARPAGRRLLALVIHDLRSANSVPRRSLAELLALRLSDAPSLTSPSPSGGRPPRSND